MRWLQRLSVLNSAKIEWDCLSIETARTPKRGKRGMHVPARDELCLSDGLQISITGSTFSDDWPSKEEVLKLIRTRKGVPVQIQDIEADVVKLLSTGTVPTTHPSTHICPLAPGLFCRGRPIFSRAEETEAPAFSAKIKGVFPMISQAANGMTQMAIWRYRRFLRWAEWSLKCVTAACRQSLASMSEWTAA